MDDQDATPPAPSSRFAGWRSVMLVLMAVLGAVVLVAIIVTLGEANRQRDRALKLQTHSFEVMILARTLASTISEAEASLGRYVISTDKQLGQLYSEQWRGAGMQIERLAKVVADNPVQVRNITALRAAYLERGEELSLTARSTNYGKLNSAITRFYHAGQARSLKRIHVLLEDIITQERGLLGDRTSDAMASVDQSSQAAKVLAVFGILIVLGAIALGWLTVEALGQRTMARAEAEAERERSVDLQRAVEAATAELKQQAIERAAAEEKLRQVQKMDAVGQLTGGIAHDFNNMLAVVLGGLELARRHIDDPQRAARHLDSAVEGASRAVALTRRLLAFSRAEALLPAAIAPPELIAGISDLLDRTLGDAITVVTRAVGRDWLIWADRHQLENALLNLAVNARDAMNGRGKLSIVTGSVALADGEIGECRAGDYVTIAVSDTGCGMSPEVLERVFEPFFTTKPVGRGTGLGLSQIFGFVRQSSGEIAIKSRPGRGTTVTLYLPRHIGELVAARAPDIDIGRAAPTRRSLAILVVEDDPRVLAATTGALEELGHAPIGCNDPLIALAMLREHEGIDLIISDVLMPGQTGPEMIAEIRPHYPQMPVLFVTGYTGEAGAGENFGGHGVLRKPFTMAALERAIVDAMDGSDIEPDARVAAE